MLTSYTEVADLATQPVIESKFSLIDTPRAKELFLDDVPTLDI